MFLIEGPNNQNMLTKYDDTTITLMKSITIKETLPSIKKNLDR